MVKVKEIIKNNYLTLFLIVFISLMFIILMINIKKGTFSIEPGVNGIGIDCNMEISADNIFTCNVSGHFGDQMTGVSFEYNLGDNLSYVSFTPAFTCADNSDNCVLYNNENGFLYTNIDETLVGDNVPIGVLRIKATNDVEVGNTYTLTLTNVNFSSVTDDLIELDDIDIEMTVSQISEEYYSFVDLNVDENKKIIKSITDGTKYEKIVEKISTSGTIIVRDKDNNEVSLDNIAKTGDSIVITLSGETYTFKVSVLGDVTGDGIIKINDVDLLYRYLKGKAEMSDEYVAAGDVASNDIIKINDVDKLYRYLKGKLDSLEE